MFQKKSSHVRYVLSIICLSIQDYVTERKFLAEQPLLVNGAGHCPAACPFIKKLHYILTENNVPVRTTFHWDLVQGIALLVGAEGFEPSEWWSQNPLPYRLATPQ